jgi:hypothetical protein
VFYNFTFDFYFDPLHVLPQTPIAFVLEVDIFMSYFLAILFSLLLPFVTHHSVKKMAPGPSKPKFSHASLNNEVATTLWPTALPSCRR